MSDSRWSGVHGKNSGLDGDKTSPCPKCGQPGVIASGDLRQTNPQGRAVAVDGSPVHCACATGTNFVIAAGNPSTAKIIGAQSQSGQQSSSRNTLRFQCADDDGRLMVDCRYVLMFPDGHTETGNTDNQGMTEWHYAESAENINLHILMD